MTSTAMEGNKLTLEQVEALAIQQAPWASMVLWSEWRKQSFLDGKQAFLWASYGWLGWSKMIDKTVILKYILSRNAQD